MQTLKNVKAIIGWATFPEIGLAREVAKLLVTKKQAACVKVIDNIESYYEWEDKLEEGKEVYLMIKSTEENVDGIKETIKEKHPFKVWEFIYTNVDGGNEDYLNWIEQVTNKSNKMK